MFYKAQTSRCTLTLCPPPVVRMKGAVIIALVSLLMAVAASPALLPTLFSNMVVRPMRTIFSPAPSNAGFSSGFFSPISNMLGQYVPVPAYNRPVQQYVPVPINNVPVQQYVPAPISNVPVQQYVPAPIYNGPDQLIAKPDIIAQEAEEHAEEDKAAGHGFGYDDHDGPETWPEKWPACGGAAQSPIDFPSDVLVVEQLPAVVRENYFAQPDSMVVENNGHTLEVSGVWPKGKEPTVRGGPLSDTYEMKQMHLHWGLDDNAGSEHTVNGRSFPMEMHVVHWNRKYGTFEKAASQPDGLTVSGYFWEIVEECNPMLEKFIKYTNQVEGAESKEVEMSVPLPIGILDLDMDAYMSYQGSLTTPPCSEVVTWMVGVKPLTLCPAQMQALRTTVKKEGEDGDEEEDIHNFRNTQPLNGRNIIISS